MIEGTMRWIDSTSQFGFLTPDDGGRDIFVRLASGMATGPVTGAQEEGSVPYEGTTGKRQDRSIQTHDLASRVEVRTRYQRGHWASGYEVAQVIDSGYRLRRPGSLDVLPEVFVPADVRRAGDGQ
jgi:cold shock CspA family protein